MTAAIVSSTPPRGVAGNVRTAVGVPAERLLGEVRRLSTEIDSVLRTRVAINRAVWGIAAGVMVYGMINVTTLLCDHGVPAAIAWMLPLMIDLAMCIGLWGDRVLHLYGRHDGWVVALRWITAVMTLSLNIAEPALRHDWVGVGIHTGGPLLLLVVAEAAGSIQRHLTQIISESRELLREAQLGADADSGICRDTLALVTGSSGQPAATDSAQVDPNEDADEEPGRNRRVESGADYAQAESPSSIAGGVEETVATADQHAAIDTIGDSVCADEDAATLPGVSETPDSGWNRAADLMWEHWELARQRGVLLCGAELDELARTQNYGSKVLKRWAREGRITAEELDSAKDRGRGRATAARRRSTRRTEPVAERSTVFEETAA